MPTLATRDPHPESLRDQGTLELLSGIVSDTQDLVAAHVEDLGGDIRERLATMGETLTSVLVAASILIVTALLLGLAIAASLVAVGVPLWIAMWSITLAVGATGFGFVLRARAKARAPKRPISLLESNPTTHSETP